MAGEEVEALIASDPALVKEACIWLRGWYFKAEERPPPPTRVTIARMTEDRVEIYWRDPPLEEHTSSAGPVPHG